MRMNPCNDDDLGALNLPPIGMLRLYNIDMTNREYCFWKIELTMLENQVV